MPPPARSQSWRLPALIIGAGVLLAVLAILLAAWSKQLLKDAIRYGCSERASWVVYRVAEVVDRHQAVVVDGGPLPAEVAAVWFLDDAGGVVARRPDDAPAPPELLLEAVRESAAEPAPITLRGPGELLAATCVPLAEGAAGSGARRAVILWDVEALRERVLAPLAEGELAAGGYAIAFLEDTEPGDELTFGPKAAMTLAPPLSFWRVAVGLRDPDAARTNLRVQTALLAALAVWLLVVLAGGVVAHARRARRTAERQASREQLLARATHELQTPLALLRAAAESVQRGAVQAPEDLERCLEVVVREEERLTRGVRRLLRHLRFENRAAEGVERSCLAEEVEAAAADLEATLSGAGLRLEVDAAAARGLLVPRELVSDVLRELLANAAKHARGAGRVRVQAGPCPGGARLVVEDVGAGLDPAARAGAFEARGGDGRAGGLGLALVREGLDLVGGRVICHDGPAGGARFTVEVPCR